TTFTLPLWLELFPDARVLHIHRRGVDVAASLRERERRHLERSQRNYPRIRVPLGFAPKRAGFTASVRCTALEGAFTLWESYVAESRRHVARLGAQALEVRYEDLAAAPRSVVERVADFCELSPTAAELSRAAGMLRGDRVAAHGDDVEIAAFAARVAERELAAASGGRR